MTYQKLLEALAKLGYELNYGAVDWWLLTDGELAKSLGIKVLQILELMQ